MQRILFISFLLLLPSLLFGQNENSGKKLVEYTLQVKENDDGYAIVVSDKDFINKQYHKSKIEINNPETVEEAVDRLNKLNFRIRATSVVNGKQVVTMSIYVDPYILGGYLDEMLKIANKFDSMLLEEQREKNNN